MSLYNNIFDAHAHYDDKWFDDDRFELLENIHTKGVCGIVNNAVDLETAKTCIEYAEKYDFMYAAVGFHPENLENIPGNYLEQLAQLSKHKKVVAIGETGLDYHWDIPKDLQKRVFEEQIRLSLDLEMPLIVHDREAHGDVYDLLKNTNQMRWFIAFRAVLSLCVKRFAWECTSASAVLLHSKMPVTVLRSPRKFRLTGFCSKPTLRIWRPCRSVASVATAQ